MGDFDKSSKWLIEHHGDALLRLAGVKNIVSWRALHSELVQPGQLPDGLIEAQVEGESEPDQYLLEIATYPETRLTQQLHRDVLLAYLSRGAVPEVYSFILRPKGQLRIGNSITLASPRGSTRLNVSWSIVELWTLPAEPLLQSGDPGVIPWVPLTDFSGSTEKMLAQCREIIDTVPDPVERTSLLAVTQVFTRLRYNDFRLLEILGGRRVMIESPLIREVFEEVFKEAEAKAEARGEARGKAHGEAQGRQAGELQGVREAIRTFLEERFGAVPTDISEALEQCGDIDRLRTLLRVSIRCADLAQLRNALHG